MSEQKLELWTDKLKALLLEQIPLLSVVTYYEVNNEGRRIETPLGFPEYRQWDKSMEFSAQIVEDQLVDALQSARQQLAYNIAYEIQNDLLSIHPARMIPQKRLPLDILREPHLYTYIVSPERWMELATQDDYYFGGSPHDTRYFYEGVETLRHNAKQNIIVKVKESGIWNLRTSLSTTYVPKCDTYQLTVRTSGYFLIKMSAA